MENMIQIPFPEIKKDIIEATIRTTGMHGFPHKLFKIITGQIKFQILQ